MMNLKYSRLVKRIAQTGLISKGLVFFLIGAMIVLALYGDDDEPIQLFEILKYIISRGAVGRILVILLAVGLLNYSLWKLIQMVWNAEGYPENFRGYFIRITWLGPFLFYLLLGGHAIVQLYKFYTGSFEYPVEDLGLAEFVHLSTGRILISFVSITLFINGITLLYLAFTGKYTIMLTGAQFYRHKPHFARIMGFTGYSFYGIALLIVSFLFAISMYTYNSSLARGGVSMFHLLKKQYYGEILLLAIALGTICYGLYFFSASFYRWNGEDDLVPSKVPPKQESDQN